MELRVRARRLSALCRRGREIDPELQLTALQALMLVAEMGQPTVTELARLLDTTMASASRNVFILSKLKRPGVPGYGLVDTRQDEHDRKYKRVFLTPKGERLVTELLEKLEGK